MLFVSIGAVLPGTRHRVSTKRKFRNISRRDAATRLVFLGQFYMVIIDHISQNQPPTWSNGLEKNYMVEYCDFFKTSFPKSLDFWRRLKTHVEDPKR